MFVFFLFIYYKHRQGLYMINNFCFFYVRREKKKKKVTTEKYLLFCIYSLTKENEWRRYGKKMANVDEINNCQMVKIYFFKKKRGREKVSFC